MRSSSVAAVLLTFLAVTQISTAQRPAGTSICDYYTNATFGDVTAAHQYLLLKIIVNTVVIGNYSATPTGISVPGILATATVNGEVVNLLPFFTGALNTTNVNGVRGQVNFLDSGGAAPLKNNAPSNDESACTSNQCGLLTHLYQMFGYLLGCSAVGTTTFPAYSGDTSLYETHKFMNLDNAQVTYFIGQVGLTAQAYGVSSADVTAVGTTLTAVFGRQCSPALALGTTLPAEGQNTCVEADCPVSSTPNCTVYGLSAPNTTFASPPPPSCPKGSGSWGVNCTLCNCNNGAACDDGPTGKGCICKPVHATGTHCQNCWFNYDPASNCKTEINPCEHCPDSDYNNCTDLTSTLCPKYASCHYAGKTGTYLCKCGGGYYATPENGECVDVNECEVGVRGGKFNACPSYSTCKNYHGTYSCTCIPPRIPLKNSRGFPRYCVLPNPK